MTSSVHPAPPSFDVTFPFPSASHPIHHRQASRSFFNFWKLYLREFKKLSAVIEKCCNKQSQRVRPGNPFISPSSRTSHHPFSLNKLQTGSWPRALGWTWNQILLKNLFLQAKHHQVIPLLLLRKKTSIINNNSLSTNTLACFYISRCVRKLQCLFQIHSSHYKLIFHRNYPN